MRLIPSVTFSAFFDSQECRMHSWEAFSWLFVSQGCCRALMTSLFPYFASERIPASGRRPARPFVSHEVVPEKIQKRFQADAFQIPKLWLFKEPITISKSLLPRRAQIHRTDVGV